MMRTPARASALVGNLARRRLAAVAADDLSSGLPAAAGLRCSHGRATPATSPTEAAPSTEPTADLAAMKKAAGIADCPTSDPKVAAVPSGLPDVVLAVPRRRPGGSARRTARQADDDQRLGSVVRTLPRGSALPHRGGQRRTSPTCMIIGIDHDDPRPELAIEFAQLSTWSYPQLADPDVVLRQRCRSAGHRRPSSSDRTARSPFGTPDRSPRQPRSATWRASTLESLHDRTRT